MVTRAFITRVSRIANNVREAHTSGIKTQRVFLVWTQWTGVVRGEGDEVLLARREILPRPSVTELSGISHRPYSIGTFEEGSVRVSKISFDRYTTDVLEGTLIPPDYGVPSSNGADDDCGDPSCQEPLTSREEALTFDYSTGCCGTGSDSTPTTSSSLLVGTPVAPLGSPTKTNLKVDFWYEIEEDGRGDVVPEKRRFRLSNVPNRDDLALNWYVILEPASESLNRDTGLSSIGSEVDDSGQDIEDF